MDRIKGSAAAELRAEIELQRRNLPLLVASRIVPVLAKLDTWIQSVEGRLEALKEMPPDEALAMLNSMLIGEPVKSTLFCGGCQAGTAFHEPACPRYVKPPGPFQDAT